MRQIPHRLTYGIAVAGGALLAACATRDVTVPAGTTPLSHDDVMTLMANTKVLRYESRSPVNMLTREDGTVEYFLKPGKEMFAQAAVVWHARGTWRVEPNGRFCVSLTWPSTRTSGWCRFIFHTDTGYGAGSTAEATHLENWDVSKN